MTRLLEKKVAIITGAGHGDGIGRAIAREFVQQGARVVITDIDSALTDWLELGSDCLAIACDVTNRTEIDAVVRSTLDRFSRIDVLVNNAGVGLGSADFMEIDERDWELSLQVNVRGVARFCQAVIPSMLEQGAGSIINVASLAGLGAIDSIPACYTASKFAAVGLSKQIAAQYAGRGIRCNALCPGSVITRMYQTTLEMAASEHGISIDEAQAREDASIPMGHSAAPAEIAAAAVYLAGEQSAYVTGVALPVAGGMAPGL